MAAPRAGSLPTLTQQSTAQLIGGSLVLDGSSLKRTFGSSGNRMTWTWSAWVKLIKLSDNGYIFAARENNDNRLYIKYNSDGTLYGYTGNSNSKQFQTTRKLRDPLAWYHILWIWDSPNTIERDRQRVYINGELTTNTQGNSYTQNFVGAINDNIEHRIGNAIHVDELFDSYISEVYFIDGQALGPGYFGYTDPLTNTWRPKKFSGNYTVNPDGYGLKWSSYWGGTAGGDYTVTNGGAFTGGTSGYIQNGSAAEIHWTPASPISISSSLQVYVTQGTSGQLELNDASVATTNNDWTEIATSGTLTKLSLLSGSGSQWVQLKAVKVDGTILTDFEGGNSFYLPFDGSAPIGQDQSGRGNDWTPVNFGGSTVISKATGALPILNTQSGGRVAVPGVRGQVGVAVTVYNSGSGNKYYLDGEEAKTVSYKRGQTVTFDTSDSTVSGHPFRFATAADAAGSTQYTTGSVTGASEGSVGAATTITIPTTAPETLYYYCTNHSGMGGSITGITTDVQVADPYASYCKLAIPLVGNGNDVSDQVNIESTASTITNSGVDFVTTQSNFYGVSGDFTGAASDVLSTGDDDAKFKMEEGDFTVECWVYSTTTSGTQNICQIIGNGGSTKYYGIWWSNSNLYFQIEGGCGSVSAGNIVMGKSQWHHLAMTRTGGKMRGFVDGVKLVEASDTLDIDDTGYQAHVGRHEPANNGFTGYIQDFRIYKGVAKYTSNFIPASTNPDILLDTPSGVTYSSKPPLKPTDGAVAFDGNGDYLSLASTTDFAFGTGDFTLECWAYHSDASVSSNYPYLFEMRDPGGGGNRISLYVTNTNTIQLWVAGVIFNTGYFGTRRWNHVAISRVSGNLRLFNNGQIVGTHTTEIDFTGAPLLIGQRDGYAAQSWPGFISNVRIVKGTGLYTSDFTPPTSPLTNITNTKLLCCQSNSSASTTSVVPTVTDGYDAGVYLKATTYADRGGSSCTVTNNGSVTSSSAGTNPFGITDAAAITGTQRVDLNMGNVSGTFFQSTWTLEMFFKTDDITEDNWFIGTSDQGASPNSGWSLDWQGNSGGTLLWNYSSGNPINTGITASSNKWHFLRVQRTPGSNSYLHIQLYDGPNSLVGSYTGTATDGATQTMNVLKIGDANANANNLDSNWMYSNVMLTAGKKSNQTVPTLSSGQRVDGASVTASLVPYGNSAASLFNPFDNDINTVLGQSTDYCTLDPLSNGGLALSDGNLKVAEGSGPHMRVNSTIAVSSGKWYYELTNNSIPYPNSGSDTNSSTGLTEAWNPAVSSYPGSDATSYAYQYASDGNGTKLYTNGGNSSWPTSSSTAGTDAGGVVMVAFDLDNSKLWFGRYGNWLEDGNPATGANPAFTLTSGKEYTPTFRPRGTGGTNATVNFGQKPFKFSPPEGFSPLCNANRPSPGLTRPDQYFGTYLYTGNGASPRTLGGLPFEPDFVWIKERSQDRDNQLYDTVRGAGNANSIASNTPYNQTGQDADQYGFLSAFNSDGFTLTNGTAGSGNNDIYTNDNGQTYVAWAWKAGGSKGTWNKDGIAYASAAAAGLDNTSGGSTGTDSKFAILRYTGTGNVITMGHSLGATPAFAIHKCLSHTGDWTVWHDGLDSLGKILNLNGTGAQSNMSSGITSWNSTQLVMDTDGGVNSSGRDYILYVWANVPGVQKFGTYEGNQSTDGPYVDLGFSPAIIIFKNRDSSANWMIYDIRRDPYNESYRCLYPNLYNDENTTSTDNQLDILSTGFKLRNNQVQSNHSQTYIYAAWAHQPEHNLYGGQSNAR